MSNIQFLQGDCLTVLKTLPDASIQCCVTSPPYYGLRDYGVEGQRGNEKTPDEYVKGMVEIFREVRRTLRDDGVLWLNLGDSYAGAGYSNHANTGGAQREDGGKQKHATGSGLKPKNLIGIPWRVAIALQADGWYLRAACPWIKRNAMPDSTKDRPTTVIESVFMLTKTSHAYYDHEAVKVAAANAGKVVQLGEKSFSKGQAKAAGIEPSGNGLKDTYTVPSKRARRASDWFFESWQGLLQDEDGEPLAFVVNTKPYKGAHFATFPPKLIEPCILSSARPDDIVLDPFGGSGTTGQVAQQHGRDAILIELNPEYIELAKKRCDLNSSI